MKKLLLLTTLLILASCEQQNTASLAAPAPADPLPDFSLYTDVQEKKQAFFDFLLPLIHASNQQIMQERALAERWIATPAKLSKKELEKLHALLVKYRITTEEPAEQQRLLLRRIYIIPPSLVLAQAANESAWGLSRFAQEGNNLFGQWCYEMGCGLIPGDRNHRAKHEVRVFETPYDSVSSYMRNLNSHPQYQTLRDLRAEQIQQDELIAGDQLAEGLVGYSERREAYVEEIQTIIRQNDLNDYDQDPLGEHSIGS